MKRILKALRELPDTDQSRSGTDVAYSVQERGADQAKWADCKIEHTHGRGVPSPPFQIGAVLGYLTYETAMALAWWRKAELMATNQWDTKVRLVPHKITYSMSAEPMEAIEVSHDQT